MIPLNGANNQNDVKIAFLEESVVFAESFEPKQLLSEQDLTDPVFVTTFALRCNAVLTPQSNMRWALKADVRAEVLERLRKEERLKDHVISTKLYINGFGKWMIHLLKERPFDLESISVTEQAKLRTAAQFVHSCLPRGVNERLESQLEWSQTKRALRVALPLGLLGREAQLRKILRAVATLPSTYLSSANVVFITGVGGSGKSALLAELVLRQKEFLDHPTVCLDFDSPTLSIPRPDRLMIAFARQLAMHYPQHAGPLRRFARELERMLSFGESRSASYRLMSHTTGIVRSSWLNHCDDLGVEELPITLVLDTFEEVVIRGRADLLSIEKWLESLVREYGFRQLSILVSGRALPKNLFSFIFRVNPLWIEVGDLSKTWAAKLLRLQSNNKIPSRRANELADRYGGNPLMLRLISRLFLDDDGDLPLERDIGQEAAQSFLYDRLLKRLRSSDEAVAEVAHPGLVLRRITPSIIRDVLAPVLGLGYISEVRARDIFEELARQVWLVEIGSDSDVLLHRKDLRRLMLKLMYHTDRSDQLKLIHAAAIKYYLSGKATDLDSTSAKLEADYHRLFIADPNLERDEAIALVRSLGADIECLLPERTAKLRQQAGVDLTEAELATLSLDERAKEEDRARSRIYKVMSESEVSASSPVQKREVKPQLKDADIDYLFASGDWGKIAKNAQSWILEQFSNFDERNAQSDSLVDSQLWKVCVACRLSETTNREKIIQTQRLILDEAKRSGQAPYILESRYHISTAEALEAAAGLIGGDDLLRSPVEWGRSNVIYGVDELRLWQFRSLSSNVINDENPELHVHPSVFRFLSKQFELGLEEIALPIGINNSLQQWLGELSQIVFSGPSLAEVASISLHAEPLRFRGSTSTIYRLGGFVMPELYPVCRFALRKVPVRFLLGFATTQAAQDAFWPRDLTGSTFETQLNVDLDRSLTILIEICDRLGLVPKLLRFGLQYVDEKTPLRRALNAWMRLERRLSGFS